MMTDRNAMSQGSSHHIRVALLLGAASLWPAMAAAQTVPVVSSDPTTAVSSPATSAPANSATPTSATPPTAAETAIGDIVVTARFRSEKLQDTPLSISAFNAKTIESSVATDIASVQKFLPNVQISQNTFSGNALTASIRGISFSDLEKSFDPAIGVSIDGVFIGTNTGANLDLNDVESIEVLRGPQGTLYGRNTVGGTISVRRTRPTGVLGIKLHSRYGSYNAFDIDGVLNLPEIADIFSVKLFALRRRADSFTINRYTGKHEKGRNFFDVGGSVLADLGSATAQLSVDYQKDRSQYPSNINLTKANGKPFGAGGTICDLTKAIGLGTIGCEEQGYLAQVGNNFKIANSSMPFRSYLDGWNAAFEVIAPIGSFNLTAITGYRNTNDQLQEESSGAPAIPVAPGVAIPFLATERDQNYKQFSQEVRVQGNLSDAVDLVAGAYYLHTKYRIGPALYNGTRTATLFFLNSPAQNYRAGQTLDSYAVFAESIVKLGSQVRLTVGGRYTAETKDFQITQTLPTSFSATGKKTFKDPTGRVILDWKPNRDTMLYASVSRGVRSGGFNGRATTAAAIGPYNPEHVNSYEAGLKATLAGGLIRFNPTFFWADYSDKQEEILRPTLVGTGSTETVVQNASAARIRGFEFDIQARPTKELTLRTSGGYLQGKYKSFIIPDLANPGKFLDVKNARNFRRLPKYTFNAGLDYLRPIGGGNSLGLTVDYAYISKITTSLPIDAFGRDTIAGYAHVDASVSFLHSDERLKKLRLSAFIRDAFHGGGRISTAVDAGVFFFGIDTPRRQAGIEATVAF